MQYAIMHARCRAGNQITGAGIGDVVQFARTQGCDAMLVDLSKNIDTDLAILLPKCIQKRPAFFSTLNSWRCPVVAPFENAFGPLSHLIQRDVLHG